MNVQNVEQAQDEGKGSHDDCPFDQNVTPLSHAALIIDQQLAWKQVSGQYDQARDCCDEGGNPLLDETAHRAPLTTYKCQGSRTQDGQHQDHAQDVLGHQADQVTPLTGRVGAGGVQFLSHGQAGSGGV